MKIFPAILIIIWGGSAFGGPAGSGYARAAEYFREDARTFPTVRLVRSKTKPARAIAGKKKSRKKIATRHASVKKRGPATVAKKQAVAKGSGRSFREIAVSLWSKLTGSSQVR